MRLGQDVLCDLAVALEHEWLLGNALGGSASSTAIGANTRRGHGLLISAGSDGKLTNALLKLEERVLVAGQSFDLGVNLHLGAPPRPAGHLLLESFRLAPWPTWRYRAGPVLLEKSVFLVHEHHAVAIRYRHVEGPSARLTLSPLVALRGIDQVQRESADVGAAVQVVPGRVQIACAPDGPRVTLWHSGSFMPSRVWHHRLAYPADRGADGEVPFEDAFVPCYIEGELAAGGAIHLVAATEEHLFRTLAIEGRLGTPPPGTLAGCVAALEDLERARLADWRRAALEGADFTARQAAAAHGGAGEEMARQREPLVGESDLWTVTLAGALEQGLVRRGHRLTFAASLPLAEERGVEALRAVPALIALRAFDPARAILRSAVEYLDEGLAPEGFAEDGTPRYGDPAPALWLVHAGELLARRSEDLALVRENLYPALESVMQFYRSGTRHGIRVDAEGLLVAGVGPSVARADVNALWYHALVAMAQLARRVGRKESGAFYLAWAREHYKCFNQHFWDEETEGLLVARCEGEPEPGIIPEQLLAVSLSPSLLPPDRAARMVAIVEEELFTPFGLREHPGSHRVLTAWLGPFFSAYLRVHGRNAEAQTRVRRWLETLHAELARGVHGHLPEAFAFAEPPRGKTAGGRRAAEGAAEIQTPGKPAPAGAPASIVAAAELLRAWIEDVDHAEEPAGVA
ncbi:MAG TPA: glycogen debranching enzyme N-terminal domain-containing protein [Candidatus Limnocylindria bacterium]|nr:glycogen debranching enzyme N-terminal domain-containing protein [Candidatus Limnocylindria bacterium]